RAATASWIPVGEERTRTPAQIAATAARKTPSAISPRRVAWSRGRGAGVEGSRMVGGSAGPERRPGPTLLLVSQSAGQLASIRAKISSVFSPLADTHSIIPFQNVPAPTSAGIVSEASKRNTSASARMAASSLLGKVEYQSSGTLWLGETNPPASIQPRAPSGVAKNSIRARTSGRSLNITIWSPAPSTGLPYSSSIGGK